MNLITSASIVDQARAFGIDIGLIEHMLGLSPTERIRMHQGALEMALALRKAGNIARSRKYLSLYRKIKDRLLGAVVNSGTHGERV
jgi:hypothetical protein